MTFLHTQKNKVRARGTGGVGAKRRIFSASGKRAREKWKRTTAKERKAKKKQDFKILISEGKEVRKPSRVVAQTRRTEKEKIPR